jgi:mono/diheme cytochrome c family protein
MRTLLHAILGSSLAGLAGLAAAQAEDMTGNAARGHRLALEECAGCHAVEKGVRGGKLPDPPGFQRLAEDPAMTPLALRVFLTTPHADMPNLILTDPEIDDIVAWIHSLK